MCGIVGVLDYAGGGGLDQALLARMRDTMTHRGPDDADLYISRRAHRPGAPASCLGPEVAGRVGESRADAGRDRRPDSPGGGG